MIRSVVLALAASLLFLGIPTAATAKGEAVAVLLVGRQDSAAQVGMEKQLIALLKQRRAAARLDAKALPILVYHFNLAEERKYCERRLGLKASQLFFVGVVRLAADRLPSEVLEGRDRVTDVKAVAAELFPVAQARVQGTVAGVGGGVDPAERYARESAAGDAAFARRDYAEALKRYEAAARVRPLAWRNEVRRASTLIALGRPRDAQKLALKAIGLAPTEAAPHGVLGLALAATGEDELAVTELRNAISLSPEWAVPHAWLAQYALGRREWTLAVAEASEAERLDPKAAPGAYVLGTVDLQHWRLTTAREWLEKAVVRQPELVGPQEMLGWTLVLQGEYDAAARVYEKLGGTAGLVGLALARYYAGDSAGALGFLDKAPSSDSLVLAVRGFALAALGRGDEALAAARKSLELGPRNPNGYEALADAQTVLGQHVPALENYRRAEELLRGWPEPQLLYKWALCARAAGRQEVRREVARRLLEGYPGSAWQAQAEELSR